MKVQFLGTGTMGGDSRALTSFIVDDQILFDIGSGTVNRLKQLEFTPPQIQYIFITHYHVDHFSDLLHFLLWRKIRNNIDQPLTIVGPAELKEKLINFIDLTHNDHTWLKDLDALNIKIISYENSTKTFTGFAVESIDVIHGRAKPCVGYVLEKDGIKLGYSGDSSDCPGLQRIYAKSDYIITEATGLEGGDIHIGLDTVKSIAKENPNKSFYIVHRADYETKPTDNVFFPNDGEIIEVTK